MRSKGGLPEQKSLSILVNQQYPICQPADDAVRQMGCFLLPGRAFLSLKKQPVTCPPAGISCGRAGFRVYLKTHDVTGSEGFLRCARHFFAGILTYFKEK